MPGTTSPAATTAPWTGEVTVMVGGSVSRLYETEAEDVPPSLVAVQLTVLKAVSEP